MFTEKSWNLNHHSSFFDTDILHDEDSRRSSSIYSMTQFLWYIFRESDLGMARYFLMML